MLLTLKMQPIYNIQENWEQVIYFIKLPQQIREYSGNFV